MSEDAAWMRPDADLGAYVGGPEPPAPPARRRRGATVAIAAGVAVALLAGVLAVATLNEDGKGTPEAAVQKLLDAVAGEDVLGALEALVPAEREVLGDRLADMAGELGRLGILSDDLDLSHVPGGDIAFDGLKLQSEALTEDMASVLVTGDRLRLAVTAADLPLGPLTRPMVDGPIDQPDPQPVDTRLVAVRESGDWYVSLGYSLADYLRRDAGFPVPDFSQGVEPRGESSPEAAVRELARAAADLDVRRLVELAPPGEGAALHAYAPLLVGDLEREARGAKAGGFQITVDALELTADEAGDEARVVVDKLAATFGAPDGGGRATFNFDGRCIRYQDPGDDEPDEFCADDPELPRLASQVAGPLTLTVVREGGSWYVSPVRSWLDSILDTFRSLDRAALEKVIAETGEEAVLGPFFSPIPFEFLFLVGRATESSEESIATGAGPCTQDPASGEVICPGPTIPMRPNEITASTIASLPPPPTATRPLPSTTTVP